MNRATQTRTIAGVVLAAGQSTRMGASKIFLPIGGESLLRRAVATALASGLDPVVVVLGPQPERARRDLAGLACRAVENAAYARGIHTSLRVGIGTLPSDADAAVVLLADMPLVTARMIAEVAERYRSTGAPLVLSDYDGVQAPPTLYARPLFPELAAAEGEGCAKRVIHEHADEAERVARPAAAMADVDRPEDYDRVRAELEAKGAQCAPTS